MKTPAHDTVSLDIDGFKESLLEAVVTGRITIDSHPSAMQLVSTPRSKVGASRRLILACGALALAAAAAVAVGTATHGDAPQIDTPWTIENSPGIEKLTQGFPVVGGNPVPAESLLETADVASIRFEVVHDPATPGVICLLTGPDRLQTGPDPWTASASCGPAAGLSRDGVIITRATSDGGPMKVFGMAPDGTTRVTMTNALQPVSGTRFFVGAVDSAKGTTVSFTDSRGQESAVTFDGHGPLRTK